MCCQSNTREFIGVKRKVYTESESCEIPLKLAVKVKVKLLTNTPVMIGETERLNEKDDTFCESAGGSNIPFLDSEKLEVTFDQQDEITPKMISITIIQLVPNPNFKECTCNCQ